MSNKGPACWCSRLGCCLWCWHFIWVVLCSLATTHFWSSSLTLDWEKQGKMAQMFESLPHLRKIWNNFLALTCPRLGPYGHLGSELVDGSFFLLSFFVSVFPSVTLIFRNKYRNPKKQKQKSMSNKGGMPGTRGIKTGTLLPLERPFQKTSCLSYTEMIWISLYKGSHTLAITFLVSGVCSL